MKIAATVFLVFLTGCSRNEQQTSDTTNHSREKTYTTGEGRPVIVTREGGRRVEAVRITVESVSVEIPDDAIWLTVNILVNNTGDRPQTVHYDQVALVDDRGRVCKDIGRPQTHDLLLHRTKRIWLIDNLAPGLSERNFAVFKMPKSAFDGDLSFGLVYPEGVLYRILIFDKAKSQYDFSQPGVFKSSVWK